MCGLCGLFDTRGRRPLDQALLRRMNGVLAHRGPDGDGFHLEPGLGLGHRRLSIIDLAGGAQPIYNEDRTVAVVYNGEIYNYLPLQHELEACGHRFRTRCDTEVIVHAWEEWGEACVERFNGIFAFALWDSGRETLFLARDHLGIKPLYYAQLADGWLAFGSELKALLAHPGLDRRLDPRAIEQYFALGYVADPDTILAGARKLPPGHSLAWRRGAAAPRLRQYWDVSFEPQPPRAAADLMVELLARLREAVRGQLMSDVPLGAFLSGGVDSSAVVAMMAGLADRPVETCSISFGDPRYNESQYAAQVAERYRTHHRLEQVDPSDFSLIDRLVGIYDEPFADSSAIPTYRVCGLARRVVTVALSGDGGDENFAGYRRYRWHAYEERVRRRLPQSVRGPLFGLLGRLYPKLDWAPQPLRAKSTLQALARSSQAAYLHSVSIFPDTLRRRLFSAAFHRELQGYRAEELFDRHAARAPTADPLSLVQYLDFKTYLPGDILTKVDRASMAHSLEVRVPILDYTLVDWVSGLDPALKLNGREGKYLFKKALEPHLPPAILYRPKMGFAVPIAQWFRGPLRERVRAAILGPQLGESGIFEPAELRRLLDAHQSGRGEYSAVLWALLMFEGFQRRVLQPGIDDVASRESTSVEIMANR